MIQHMHTCIHAYRPCTHARMHACMHTMHAYIWITSSDRNMHIIIDTYIHTCMYACILVYIDIDMCTNTNTYTYLYLYTSTLFDYMDRKFVMHACTHTHGHECM